MDDSLANIAAEFDEEFNEAAKKEESQCEAGTSKAATSIHSLKVNPKQRGNPILKSLTNVVWEYDDIVPDYQMGATVCALFLSLRYHNLNPDYIHDRLKALGKMYELRVLLVQVDLKDPHHLLKNLTRICILADMTLILAWSPEEAGKIIETYKIYEKKPANMIMEKSESSPHLKLVQALTSIKPVNKTDALTLITRFKTLEGITKASEYQLSECPGFGARKAKKLYQTLHENFNRQPNLEMNLTRLTRHLAEIGNFVSLASSSPRSDLGLQLRATLLLKIIVQLLEKNEVSGGHTEICI